MKVDFNQPLPSTIGLFFETTDNVCPIYHECEFHFIGILGEIAEIRK